MGPLVGDDRVSVLGASGASGAAAGVGASSPPKISCFQCSKRDWSTLMSLVLAGPISRAAITLPRGPGQAVAAHIQGLTDSKAGGVLRGLGRRHADNRAVLEQHAVETAVRIVKLQLDPAFVVDLLGRTGGPVTTTAPVASLVTETPVMTGLAVAFRPSIVTASPGRTAKTIWVDACGGRCTSVPSAMIKPSTGAAWGQRILGNLALDFGRIAGRWRRRLLSHRQPDRADRDRGAKQGVGQAGSRSGH